MDKENRKDFNLLELIILIKNNLLLISLIILTTIILATYFFIRTQQMYEASTMVSSLVSLQNKLSVIQEESDFNFSEDQLLSFFYEVAKEKDNISNGLKGFVDSQQLTQYENFNINDAINNVSFGEINNNNFKIFFTNEDRDLSISFIDYYLKKINEDSFNILINNYKTAKDFETSKADSLRNITIDELKNKKTLDAIDLKSKIDTALANKEHELELRSREYTNLLRILRQNLNIASSLGWHEIQFNLSELVVALGTRENMEDPAFSGGYGKELHTMNNMFLRNRFFNYPPYVFGTKLLTEIINQVEQEGGFSQETANSDIEFDLNIKKAQQPSYSTKYERNIVSINNDYILSTLAMNQSYKYLLSIDKNFRLVNYNDIIARPLRSSYYLYLAVSITIGILISLLYLLFKAQFIISHKD